ncbi:MAG: hypothetical protein V5A16_03585 [Haloplanus sp.]
MATPLSLDLDGEAIRADRLDLDRRLRRCGVAVAERELRAALGSLDGLTPAQQRTVALMAGRIAAGVLAPARDVADDGDERAVARLFDPEHIRDRT